MGHPAFLHPQMVLFCLSLAKTLGGLFFNPNVNNALPPLQLQRDDADGDINNTVVGLMKGRMEMSTVIMSTIPQL
jgi:hypothetical protein